MTDAVSYIYLLRHGATDYNLLNPPRLQGRCIDRPLSETGRRQAALAAAFLAGRSAWTADWERFPTCPARQPIAAVYTSPMLRARQTAEAIAQLLGLTPELVEELTECDVGRWEGRSWPEIEIAEPDAYRQFMANPYEHGYGGGENLRQVEERVLPAFERIAAENLGRSVAVVAHNVVNRVYLGHLLGVPPARRREVVQGNCGISLVSYEEGQASVVVLNSVCHLDEI